MKYIAYIAVLVSNAFMAFANPNVSNPRPKSEHEKWEIVAKVKVIKIGACYYMIDGNGEVISGGYHELERLSNGALIGKLGSVYYLIREDGKRISHGFHEFVPMESGYKVTLGAGEYSLDASGKLLDEAKNREMKEKEAADLDEYDSAIERLKQR